ncbi:rhodanese-like domain-containing protein [Rhodocyclus tenuis]|uniref:Rhodanese-related sulfurtransferase n=1 Tax=Rhodocyclus tenuis TaxID=1066 RepID=A0A840G681_RHOTE|nr:rhodanese-like domain-containing protein [Rhodocyclus tenuis]MBB4247396.1 rhodanese-related sulfurtransferase [Rhodocyclus tenuis]MBK1681213.1 sulfurtransferase [Rhodocyclus tenuis]
MEFIQQNILLVAVAVTSGVMLLASFIRRPGSGKSVTPTQATLLINREDALTIDVREPNEYAAGHLPDSRNIPAAKLAERIGELEKFKERALIVVCQSGARSASASAQLGKAGFTQVHNLEGGIAKWVEAGLPIKKGGKK